MMRITLILIAAMLLPASALHAASTTFSYNIIAPYPEFYTITASYSWPETTHIGPGCCAYSFLEQITQLDDNSVPIQTAVFSLELRASDPTFPFDPNQLVPVLATHGQTSVTFVLAEGVNHFSGFIGVIIAGLNGNVSLVETFSTPIPPAIALFTAGLGLVGWLSRGRRAVAY
jgi:hypothetical protein